MSKNVPADPHVAIVTTAGGVEDGALTISDGTPLKRALARAQSHARRKAFLLVLPLLAFIILTFVVPIFQMLYRSVDSPNFHDNMPNMVAWFAQNPRGTEPDETAFTALVEDLKLLKKNRKAGLVGTRINYELAGSRRLFTKGARKAAKLEPPYKEALLKIDPKWSDPKLWQVMRGAATRFTNNFYLAAIF